MSESDRHINFKLMRDHILSLQDGGNAAIGQEVLAQSGRAG